jgi:putative hydrolase of the HAD superfamily
MKKPLRVIFDLDDTLYPERAFALSGFRAAATWAAGEWGIDDMAPQMASLLDDGHLGAVFKMALARERPEYCDEDLARLIDVYRNHEPTLALFDDAPAALAHSAQYGPLGLITDGTHWVQKNKVEALGIAGHFKHIVYTGALGGRDFHKPHPRAFELMEAELAAPDALFVYIGDNPAKDFVAPNARGWGTVQVVRANGIHDARAEVEGGAPQHEIESLDELGSVLEALSQRT